MFANAYKWVGKCEKCKLFSGKPKLIALLLRPFVIEEPSKKWGLDFIGPLNPTYSAWHTHILTVIDYFTKWVETSPVKKTTLEVVIKYLMENILVSFKVRKTFL